MATKVSMPFIPVKQMKRTFYLARITAKVLTDISYAAVWRIDEEEGAVQRVLDPKRISDVKQFVLKGGDYASGIILNWVSTENPLSEKNGELSFEVGARLAQLVDGQHRVAGLRGAIETNPKIGEIEIPVSIYSGLTTQECADIFLSINEKQKPVPRSLVVDLYGVASDQVVDPVTERARDIADYLNEEEDSPYRSLIRLANDPRSKFGIAISTVVEQIKPLVGPKDLLATVGLHELNMQKTVLFNFFNVLKKWYGKRWDDRKNIFLTSAGFVGAIGFFKTDMLYYCNSSKDFQESNMAAAMKIDRNNLIERDEVKGLQGRASWTAVHQKLKDRFKPNSSSQSQIKL